MAMMVSSLYDALRAANVDDEKPRRAAEDVANFDNRIHGVERDLAILKWMLGTNIAISIATPFRVFS